MQASSAAAALALVGMAAFLQGCGDVPKCAELKIANGILKKASEGDVVTPACDDGFEYKGEDLECIWAGYACGKGKDGNLTESCKHVVGFGEKGTGLSRWRHKWNSFIKEATEKVDEAKKAATEKVKGMTGSAPAPAPAVKRRRLAGNSSGKPASPPKTLKSADLAKACVQKAAKGPAPPSAPAPAKAEKKFESMKVELRSGSMGSVFLGALSAMIVVGGLAMLAMKLNRRRNTVAAGGASADFDMEGSDEAVE